jgi:hypothetical protein
MRRRRARHADQATDGDDRVGEVEVRGDDGFSSFVAALQPVEAVVPGVRALHMPPLSGLDIPSIDIAPQ